MASSTGNIQIGKNASDSTRVIGDLIIQEPIMLQQGNMLIKLALWQLL